MGNPPFTNFWDVSTGLQWTGFLEHQMLELPWIKLRCQHYTSMGHKELAYRSFWFLWLIDLINIPTYLQLYLERLSSNSYDLTDYSVRSWNMISSTQGSSRMNPHDFFLLLFSLFCHSCKTACMRLDICFIRSPLQFSTCSMSTLIWMELLLKLCFLDENNKSVGQHIFFLLLQRKVC